MPYALIPDGFKLQKVTKMQQEAISAKRSHDDAVALLANPNTPLVVGAGLLIVGTPFLIDRLLDEIKELVPDIPDFEEVKKEAKSKVSVGGALVSGLGQQGILSLKQLVPDVPTQEEIKARLKDLGLTGLA